MANTLPLPTQEPIVGEGGFINDVWARYFVAVGQAVSQAPNRIVSPAQLVTQGASIATTSIAPGQVAAGLYRLTYYARITQAATVNSSLTVTLGWTDHTTAQSISGAAMVGNTTTTLQSGTILVYSDAQAPITYSTAYVSVGATAMTYLLYVTLETVAL